MGNMTPSDSLRTPPSWLDDVTGEEALTWARSRTAEAESRLGGPDLATLETRIRSILDSPDRIPLVTVRDEWAFNFWTDTDHPRGLWRLQHLDSYLAGDGEWEILLDIDALSAEEGHSWVWHGARVLHPDHDRALIDLSEAGSDADLTREFDIPSRTWVDDGFSRATAKGSMDWIDRNTVWLSTDLGPGTVSSSGYPLQVRIVRRGQDSEDAQPVVVGAPSDMAVGAVHDPTDGFERSWISVSHDFYHSTTYLLPEGSPTTDLVPVPIRVDVPADSDAAGWRNWLLVLLHSDWQLDDRTWATGTLLAFDLETFLTGNRAAQALFTPDEHTVLQGWTVTRHHLVLTASADVVPRILVLTPPDTPGLWRSHDLDTTSLEIPPLSSISARPVTPLDDDRVWLSVSGFTTPTTLLLLDLTGDSGDVASARVARRAPALFDATGVAVSQHFATSRDGTRVPYFQLGRADARTDGGEGDPGAPTVLYGYGGFEVSLLPGYSPVLGAALLERGGTYVIANIRGGGEYGPSWHQAALTRDRPRAYEDFEAVARDLIARGVTTPSRLGIQGGSNGGLLTGNMLMRTPQLFGAVVIQAPLLDMRRYHTLSAGASWMAEYGDPDDPQQWEFIRTFSPFHLFDPDRAYPPVLITTSTRDDRVHPAHARTLAWRMFEAGCAVTYVENTEGGHSGAADTKQRAHMQALVWEFFWRQLG